MDVTSITPDGSRSHYRSYLREARSCNVRALDRVDRALRDAKADLASLDPNRIIGATVQADDAYTLLAAAERYRRRNSEVIPRAAAQDTLRAVRELDAGTQILRRVFVLMADPEIGGDPFARGAILSGLDRGRDHYSKGRLFLDDALMDS